jgi:uncharacterized protein YhbP (UPF0306 family)
MDQRIHDFLKTQRICVLAVELPNGSPHAATVHFANAENPFLFFFETSRETRKAEALLGSEVSRSSLVIGVDESNKKTLQLDGEVRIIKPEETEIYDRTYVGKFSEKAQKLENPENIKFVFTPTWWRFSDFTVPEGKLILTSDSPQAI